jgi:Tfp pilus assembly protein PilO
MENQEQNNNSKLKAIILVLALLLIGSLAYMFKMSSDSKQLETEFTTESSEKEAALKDLAALKTTYDAAIAENTSMSEELIAEREKVIQLMEDLKKSKGDAASMRKYKQQYFALEAKMNNLVRENDALKKLNEDLTTNLDSTKTILVEAKEYNQVLVGQNEDLTKTVEKAAKLSILNLKTSGYKVKSSGKEIATDRASRVDLLKVNFTIAENSVAKSGDKEYYVQIIDSKNNVLGDKKDVLVNGSTLSYSFISKVAYANSTVDVSENLPGKGFEKGTYFVNIFDKGTLVGKTSFSLR